jgi:hypothetical protein
LANYWRTRKQVFHERAFLPINLSVEHGALTAYDVRMLKTGYCINLPRDEQGRSVLYLDMSKKPPEMSQTSLGTIFFFGQRYMENEVSRTDGFVLLRNISNPFAADGPPEEAALSKELMVSCMPIRPHRVHLLYISPPGMNIMPLFINTGTCRVRVKSKKKS